MASPWRVQRKAGQPVRLADRSGAEGSSPRPRREVRAQGARGETVMASPVRSRPDSLASRFWTPSDSSSWELASSLKSKLAILRSQCDRRWGRWVVFLKEELSSFLVRGFEQPTNLCPLPFGSYFLRGRVAGPQLAADYTACSYDLHEAPVFSFCSVFIRFLSLSQCRVLRTGIFAWKCTGRQIQHASVPRWLCTSDF